VHLEHAKEMSKINDDMEEFLMMAKPGTSFLAEMNNAFEGKDNSIYEVVEERKVKTSNVDSDEPEYTFKLKKVGYNVQKKESLTDVLKRPLEPIREELNEMAIVPVTYDHQKKQRNEMLKQKAKLLSQGIPKQSNGARVLYDEDLFNPPKEKTFVTGGGVPGKRKVVGDEESDEDKYFLNEEDELLDIVDK
jgi:hypothetical protein